MIRSPTGWVQVPAPLSEANYWASTSGDEDKNSIFQGVVVGPQDITHRKNQRISSYLSHTVTLGSMMMVSEHIKLSSRIHIMGSFHQCVLQRSCISPWCVGRGVWKGLALPRCPAHLWAHFYLQKRKVSNGPSSSSQVSIHFLGVRYAHKETITQFQRLSTLNGTSGNHARKLSRSEYPTP